MRKNLVGPLITLSLLVAACATNGPDTAGLVEIDGLWSTTLTATESSCEQVPVGTVVTGDVTFETNGNEVTATNASGGVSTGTRNGNTVTLTRSDTAQWGEAYEVVSVSDWEENDFAGESVYTLEGGCVITWAFTGSRVPN